MLLCNELSTHVQYTCIAVRCIDSRQSQHNYIPLAHMHAYMQDPAIVHTLQCSHAHTVMIIFLHSHVYICLTYTPLTHMHVHTCIAVSCIDSRLRRCSVTAPFFWNALTVVRSPPAMCFATGDEALQLQFFGMLLLLCVRLRRCALPPAMKRYSSIFFGMLLLLCVRRRRWSVAAPVFFECSYCCAFASGDVLCRRRCSVTVPVLCCSYCCASCSVHIPRKFPAENF